MARTVCLSFPPVPGDRALERLRSIDPGIEVIVAPYLEEQARRNRRRAMTIEELRATAELPDEEQRRAFAAAEVILALDVPVGLIDLAPRLRWVHCAGAGVDHLAGAGLPTRRILVTNSSGVASTSISEFVIGRLLAVWKRFDELARSQQAKQWTPLFGRTFAGSVVGIVGVGAIGGAVARLAKALGATVLGIRRSGRAAPHVDEMFTSDRLLEVLPRCDAVVLAAPGEAATERLIDRAALAAMKPGAVLCNVARGALVDETSLTEALRGGTLAAAILDVFECEPLPAESPLWTLPNCLVSAHCSVSLDRYMDDVIALFEGNLRRYLRGEPLENLVEASELPP